MSTTFGDSTTTNGNVTQKGFTAFYNTGGSQLSGYVGDGANLGGGAGTDDLTLRSVADMYFLYSNGTLGLKMNTSGHITPGADNTQDLGSSSLRWRNIYTADLQLSNEGKEGGNEIDGTTGDWTIQEGDENLFVINRITGKKFKMNLTEV